MKLSLPPKLMENSFPVMHLMAYYAETGRSCAPRPKSPHFTDNFFRVKFPWSEATPKIIGVKEAFLSLRTVSLVGVFHSSPHANVITYD
jgi:hypothetical protein